MCGLVGTVYGVKEREPEEQSYLKWLFIYLMLLSERRGPFATGIAWLKDDGSHCIFKRPMRAVEFVKMKQFLDAIAGVDDNTTWLAGHTRWPTRGAVDVTANAQPLRSGSILTTANGTILNADVLFKRFKLPRFAEVDSEIIPRMADDTLRDGRIDIPAIKERLALCRGQISAVMASKLDPKTMVITKGNKPLELRYHPGHQAIIYASDPAYLDVALTRETGWEEIVTMPMTIMSFNVDDLPHFNSVSFKLAGRRI
ncbi:MAG: class II glutamine amidotransferase [Armatimonadota bacterium]